MTTSAFFSSRYTSLNGATKKAEVRTISGLPSRRHFDYSLQIYNSQYLSIILVLNWSQTNSQNRNQIAVRRAMPPNLFWKKSDILLAAKQGLIVSNTV
jgi:hypothetical protein